MDTKYLFIKDNTWVFRIRIPKELQFYYENNKEYLKSTKAHKDNLEDAHKVRNYLLSKIKLQFDYLRNELKAGNIKTKAEKLAIENKLKIEQARKENPDLLSEVQADAVDDVLQFIDLDERQKTNPNKIDAILKSDTTGKAKEYIDNISNKSFTSFLDEFEKENKRDKIKARGLDQKISKLKAFSKYHSTIDGIDRPLVVKYKNYLFDKKGLTPKTIGGYLNPLGQYWDFLADSIGVKEAQQGNPFRDIKLPKHLPGKRLAWRAKYFGDGVDDVKDLLETKSSSLNSNLKHAIIIAMFTGARIEEICSIKKDDIKSHQQVRCIYFSATKSDRYHNFGRRYVPIASQYNDLIIKLMNQTPGDYLLNETVLKKYNKRSHYLSKGFGKHKEKCGHSKKEIKTSNLDKEISFRDFHSFRPTLNTFFKRQGLDASFRSALCGWKEDRSKSMADDVYLKLEQAYPYHKRKQDIETIIKLYSWFNSNYYNNNK